MLVVLEERRNSVSLKEHSEDFLFFENISKSLMYNKNPAENRKGNAARNAYKVEEINKYAQRSYAAMLEFFKYQIFAFNWYENYDDVKKVLNIKKTSINPKTLVNAGKKCLSIEISSYKLEYYFNSDLQLTKFTVLTDSYESYQTTLNIIYKRFAMHNFNYQHNCWQSNYSSISFCFQSGTGQISMLLRELYTSFETGKIMFKN